MQGRQLTPVEQRLENWNEREISWTSFKLFGLITLCLILIAAGKNDKEHDPSVALIFLIAAGISAGLGLGTCAIDGIVKCCLRNSIFHHNDVDDVELGHSEQEYKQLER